MHLLRPAKLRLNLTTLVENGVFVNFISLELSSSQVKVAHIKYFHQASRGFIGREEEILTLR